MKTAPGRERPGSWGVPAWVRKAGLTSWLMLGIAGALVLAGLAFAATLTAIGIGVFTKLRESGAFDEPARTPCPAASRRISRP